MKDRVIEFTFIAWIVVLVVALSSCATYDSTMHNSNGGAYTCKTQSFGIISTLRAGSIQKQCETQAHAAGYK